MDYKAELVGCFGRPVAENPTGVMQEAAFAAAGLNWRYLTIEVGPENLRDAVQGVRAFGMRGINLTIPHKVAVIEYLDELNEAARLIGAVNTVVNRNGWLVGDNTDGKGFLRGVRTDAGFDPRGKRAVMLGAGGAARAIGTELLLAGAADLLVVNRSVERGETTVGHLRKGTGGPLRFERWDGTFTVPADTDLLVNATSIGLFPNVEAMPDVSLDRAPAKLLVCDAVFNPAVTGLLKLARSKGMPVLDGLSMLVYQGVIGFELWTGQRAPEAVMKKALQEALGALP